MRNLASPARTTACAVFGLFIASLHLFGFPVTEPFPFQRISPDDGLTRGAARVLLQDHLGFVWIGTDSGLCRYDGHRFQSYFHDPNDPNSLPDDDITAIIEDESGILWIGTGDGICRYDRTIERFTRYRQPTPEGTDHRVNFISSLAVSPDGKIWFGTYGSGAFVLEPSSGRIDPIDILNGHAPENTDLTIYAISITPDQKVWMGTHDLGLFILNSRDAISQRYVADPTSPNSIVDNTIRSILQAQDGSLWFGTNGGVSHLNITEGQFTNYRHDPEDPNSIGSPYVEALREDRDGNIWMGTDGKGISLFHPKSNTFRHLKSTSYDLTTISSDVIRDIMEDSAGDIWVAHYPLGVSYANRLNAWFHSRQTNPENANSLPHNSVTSFAEDSQGRVWISTDGGGLARWNRETNQFQRYQHSPGKEGSISAPGVLGIAIDSQDTVWAGTWQGGLNRLDHNATNFVSYQPDKSDPGSLSNPHVFTVLVDRADNVWAGTLGGLNRFDRSTQSFVRYLPDPEDTSSIGNQEIWTLHEGPDGQLWIGTRNGVSQYFSDTDSFKNYPPRKNEPDGLKDPWISTILHDSEGRIWLGTHGAGLQRFYPESNRYHAITQRQGLADNVVCGILEDSKGELWVSTYDGISRYDPDTGDIQSFRRAEGLASGQFNRFSAHTRLSDDLLIFGSTQGFIWFDPIRIQENLLPPLILLESLKILNQEIRPNQPDSPLIQSITETRDLTLDHHASLIQFEFAAPSFRKPKSTKVYYRLKDFDPTWREAGRDFTADYANLPPGKYHLQAFAINGDGIPSDNRVELSLQMLPAIWQRTSFKVVSVLLLLAGIISIHRARLRLIRQHFLQLKNSNHLLEKEIATRKEIEQLVIEAKERAVQSEKAKSRFLANMSHEIRTPLNGVIGMNNLMLDGDLDEEQRARARTVKHSAESLLVVVNDILDFSKIEAGRLELENTEFEIGNMLEGFAKSMSIRAEQKNLDFVCPANVIERTWFHGDPGRICQILANLVSNAIKFTDEGEVVVNYRILETTDETSKIKFTVTDTGIGLTPSQSSHLFEDFTQADTSITRKFGGTGLGLSISKQLSELMDGEIGVESVPNQGSRFWFSVVLQNGEASERPEPRAPEGLPIHQVLVADPNKTNRELVCAILTRWQVPVAEATSGREALDWIEGLEGGTRRYSVAIINQQLPDCTGLELASKIRHDRRSENVKLVLQTIHSNIGHREILIQKGFSGFVFKPIDQSELFNVLQGIGSTDGSSTKLVSGESSKIQKRFDARVLLVEDNTTNQLIVQSMLRKFGVSTDIVSNGQEAIDSLRDFDYELVLMDCQMPVMDGLEATRRIRQPMTGVKNPEIPIVAMTANAMKGDREACLTAGMNGYISKPLLSKAVEEELTKWLSAAPPIPSETRSEQSETNPPARGPSPNDDSDDQPILDLTPLKEDLGANEELLAEVVSKFKSDFESRLQDYHSAFEERNWDQLITAIHQIKSTSAAVGAKQVSAVAAAIEKNARLGNYEEVQQAAPSFEQCVTRLNAALQNPMPTAPGK